MREHNDPEEKTFEGTPLTLDRHRILHSTSFRRLGYKTQVFVPFEADHFRTRLTHTIEVAHIARLIANKFGANPDLAETISLAHDLGHGPFGHSSETILNKILKDVGGFEHNKQSIRVVKYLEHPYPWFVGLNLTRATLLGLELHDTPYDKSSAQNSINLIEAQIANFADRFAYDVSDLEDAFGAGFVKHENIVKIPLYKRIWDNLSQEHKSMPIYKIRRVICDNLQKLLIDSLYIDNNEIKLSDNILAELEEFEQFMLETVYLHPSLKKTSQAVHRIIERLFEYFRNHPNSLSERFYTRIETDSIERVIADYITGMTDRFCLRRYIEIFGEDEAVRSIEIVTVQT